ncbi:Mobile element protein (plasmid) [Escherichia coli]|nr:Mobile element protein [Escherichia coli]
MTKNTRFSPEVRQRAVRMVLESQSEYDSQWATICSIAPKIGCTPETLRVWVRQHERDTGGGDGGLTTAERQRLKELERENRELRRSNDILRQASAYFAKAEFDRLWKKNRELRRSNDILRQASAYFAKAEFDRLWKK